jgi:hypothetical protein
MASNFAWVAAGDGFQAGPEHTAQAHLLRCVFGLLPFRDVDVESSWLAWNAGIVVGLARAIDEEQTFNRLPILADALEEAGCNDPDLLGHCRQAGLHTRGCWVIDLLLAGGYGER